MSIEADLAAIDEAILAQRIGHLAASARAQQASLAIYDDDLYATPESALAERGFHRVEHYTAAPPVTQPWYRNRWRLVAISAAVLAAGGLVTLVVWIVRAVSSAASSLASQASGAMSGMIGILALVLLAMLCSRGGRGRGGFSGTFTGRMH